jgi:hypothetical protein
MPEGTVRPRRGPAPLFPVQAHRRKKRRTACRRPGARQSHAGNRHPASDRSSISKNSSSSEAGKLTGARRYALPSSATKSPRIKFFQGPGSNSGKHRLLALHEAGGSISASSRIERFPLRAAVNSLHPSLSGKRFRFCSKRRWLDGHYRGVTLLHTIVDKLPDRYPLTLGAWTCAGWSGETSGGSGRRKA